MLAFSDVREIADLDMRPFALRVVQHEYQPINAVKMYGCPQTSYPRKNWSSMMLMDCAKLKIWSKEVVETQTGAYLHRFQDIPDAQIGELPRTWNTLDWMDGSTKLIHYTNGGPWFEQYVNHPHADVWFRYRDEMIAASETRYRSAPRISARRFRSACRRSADSPRRIVPRQQYWCSAWPSECVGNYAAMQRKS